MFVFLMAIISVMMTSAVVSSAIAITTRVICMITVTTTSAITNSINNVTIYEYCDHFQFFVTKWFCILTYKSCLGLGGSPSFVFCHTRYYVHTYGTAYLRALADSWGQLVGLARLPWYIIYVS